MVARVVPWDVLLSRSGSVMPLCVGSLGSSRLLRKMNLNCRWCRVEWWVLDVDEMVMLLSWILLALGPRTFVR